MAAEPAAPIKTAKTLLAILALAARKEIKAQAGLKQLMKQLLGAMISDWLSV